MVCSPRPGPGTGRATRGEPDQGERKDEHRARLNQRLVSDTRIAAQLADAAARGAAETVRINLDGVLSPIATAGSPEFDLVLAARID